jgi:hypothetical protein
MVDFYHGYTLGVISGEWSRKSSGIAYSIDTVDIIDPFEGNWSEFASHLIR